MTEGKGRGGHETRRMRGTKELRKDQKVMLLCFFPPKDGGVGPDPSFTNKIRNTLGPRWSDTKHQHFRNPNVETRTSALPLTPSKVNSPEQHP
jgi:hypothetical protein